MKNLTPKIKILIGSLPVAFFSFVIVSLETREERCYGMIDGFFDIVLSVSLILSFLIFTIIQLKKIFKRLDTRFRLTILFSSLILTSFALWLTKIQDDYFLDKAILKAQNFEDPLLGKLTLRENKNFSASYSAIDWSCTKVGKFKIIDDTLFLDNRIEFESMGLISSKYLIQNNEFLLPIQNSKIINDSAKWMQIIPK